MSTFWDRKGTDDWRLTDRLQAPHGKGDPFAAAMRATRMSMLITDPRQDDNPIVYCNESFLRLTGYQRDEVVGRNCRFLQGPETDSESVDLLRQALADRRDISIDILNYRKDGTAFWNALYVSPVIDEAGTLQFFFASHLDVTDRKDTELKVRAEKERFQRAVKERTIELEEALETQKMLLNEVDHRVKNNLQMVASLIIMQSRAIADPTIREALHTMLARVEALSTVHRKLYQTHDMTSFDVSHLVRDLVNDLISAFGSDHIRAELDLEPVSLPADKAAPLALMVNELVTNSLKHAFNKRMIGVVGVRVRREGGRLYIDVYDDGDGINGAARDGSFGLRLVRSLSRQLGADVEWHDGRPGTRVSIALEPDVTQRHRS